MLGLPVTTTGVREPFECECGSGTTPHHVQSEDLLVDAEHHHRRREVCGGRRPTRSRLAKDRLVQFGIRQHPLQRRSEAKGS